MSQSYSLIKQNDDIEMGIAKESLLLMKLIQNNNLADSQKNLKKIVLSSSVDISANKIEKPIQRFQTN